MNLGKWIVGGLLMVTFFVGSAQISFESDPQLLEEVNTPFGERFIYLSDEGDLYFSRKQHPDNKAGQSDRGDIWKTIGDTVELMSINSNQFESPIGFTSDGAYFLFNQVVFKKGSYKGSVLAKDAKGKITDLPIPFFKSKAPEQTGSLSANGKYLLLSLENSKGYGVDDLYVCILDEDGMWSAPKNLGRTINTALQEMTPFLAADQKTLFFASNGHAGSGSFDIFSSTRLDDTWINWSIPKNLGSAINTTGAETSFLINREGTYAYFASTKDSDGYADILKVKIASEIDAVEEEAVAINMPTETESEMVSIQLRDVKTQLPISGKAIVIGKGDTVRSGSDNQIVLNIEGGGAEVELKSDNYLSKMITIQQEDLLADDAIIVSLEPLNEGNLITFNNVLFYRGTANFIEGSEKELDLVVEMMNEHPEIKIALKGHTDNVGNTVLNLELSRERVKAVESYLISQGIQDDRISGEGYGGSQPVASNEKEETRRLNRRVEFEIKKN